MSVSVPSIKFNQQVDLTCDSETSTSTKGSGSSGAGSSSEQHQLVSSSKKRVIDETLLSPEEAHKLQARRAYNRECATRARKRTKNLVAQLQDEVKELRSDKGELSRIHAVMRAQLELLEKQHKALLFRQAMSDRRNVAMAVSASGFAPRQATTTTLGSSLLSDFRLAGGLTADAAARARLMYYNQGR